jgi:hypothetical protein
MWFHPYAWFYLGERAAEGRLGVMLLSALIVFAMISARRLRPVLRWTVWIVGTMALVMAIIIAGDRRGRS